MKKNILLLETITQEAYNLLAKHFNIHFAKTPYSGGKIAAKHPIYGIVTRGKGAVNQTLISQCDGLAIIARCGVGLDNIDTNFAKAQGIKIVNAPGINADTVAEHTLGLMLMLQRNLYNSIKATKENSWDYRKIYKGDEIRGKTLGILGMGNIGKRVARFARVFGMTVQYWDLFVENTTYPKIAFENLLKTSDIITIHLPLAEGTKHLIGTKELALFQKHAILINTSRGGIIDEEALINTLNQNKIGGFGADVLAQEPPILNNLLLKMPNVLITPHSASLTKTTYAEMCQITVDKIIQHFLSQ